MIQSQSLDNERMSMYPSLDYRQLYNALTQLMDVVPLVHVGLHGECLLFIKIRFREKILLLFYTPIIMHILKILNRCLKMWNYTFWVFRRKRKGYRKIILKIYFSVQILS